MLARKIAQLTTVLIATAIVGLFAARAASAADKPNIVMLMTDDTGWNDFGAYGGGANLGHPTPKIDQIAKEGAVFTSWYGQASCTAGRASFMTGRIPIRSALSVVVVPGDPNGITKSTPTIAEFFQKNGYSTYFSGKWHLGDQPKFYPIEHGFDEMKAFAAYYPGVYTYDDTDSFAHPWFPKYNPAYWAEYQKIVNLYEWEGTAGKPATKVARIDYDYLHEFDVRQANYAVDYIKAHAKGDKPFFMDVNFMKMHNPNIPAKAFIGKSHLGNYSDAMMELDSNIGRIMDEIRAEAPNTIVIITADNGAWQDAWPDAGTVPFRGEKGSPFEGGFRVPGIMWWPNHIPAGARYGEMMSHIDCWATLASMVGLTPRRMAHGRTMTASLSISTALTRAPISWARHRIRPVTHLFISTAKPSPARALTSAAIPRTPISKLRGNTSIPPKTPGSGHSRISAPSGRSTI
jgi:arylsulfatase